MRFNNGYTAPLCGPSRALILTGRYAFRTGAVNQDMCLNVVPANEVFIPAVLKTVGYKTTMVGKWGQLPLQPSDFGFDDYIRFKGSGVYWSKGKAKAEMEMKDGREKKAAFDKQIPENVKLPYAKLPKSIGKINTAKKRRKFDVVMEPWIVDENRTTGRYNKQTKVLKKSSKKQEKIVKRNKELESV
jgi:arylsulfatase A-like enzyme